MPFKDGSVGHERENESPNVPARIAHLCRQTSERSHASAQTYDRVVIGPASVASRVVRAAGLSVQRAKSSVPSTSLRAAGLSATATLRAASATRNNRPTRNSRVMSNSSPILSNRPTGNNRATGSNRFTDNNSPIHRNRVMARHNLKCNHWVPSNWSNWWRRSRYILIR